MMLMASGANHGIQKSIPHYLGICFGFPVMVAAVGFGMGTLFSQYPTIYLCLKVTGISYLFYLAWKIANAGNLNASPKIRKPFSFIQATAFQWLNPKAWAMAIGALAAFSNEERFVESVLTVILVYFVMGFICMAIWLKLGGNLKRFLSTDNRIKYFNIAMAVLLVLSIVPIAFTGIGNVA
jgi:threonine/homoserine/homoserine lactone efflux protein